MRAGRALGYETPLAALALLVGPRHPAARH